MLSSCPYCGEQNTHSISAISTNCSRCNRTINLNKLPKVKLNVGTAGFRPCLICGEDIEVNLVNLDRNVVAVVKTTKDANGFFPVLVGYQHKQCNLMGKAVTKVNYIGHYTSWCARNSFSPLSYDVLIEIFYGCETDQDFSETLNVLYDIQNEGLKLSFMKAQTKDSTEALLIRLRIRLELFKRVPTATNMLLAYNLIEEVTLKTFESGKVDISDEVNKQIERFDKLKNLALGTKYINERKLAFERSVEIFNKLTKV